VRVASARRPSPRFDAVDSQLRTAVLKAIDSVIRQAASQGEDTSDAGPALTQIRALEQLVVWSEHEIGRHAVQAIAEGSTLADIGEALGMSKQAVAHKLRHLDAELLLARTSRATVKGDGVREN
jgi:hypothetical protein